PEAYSAAAIDFHLAVGRGAHNTVLSYFLEGLQHVLRDWVSNTYAAHPEETVREPDEHVPIYEAIRARDAARARHAMAAHVDEAGARLRRMLTEAGGAGDGEGRTTRLAWAWRAGE
ncbi:MAG TPA: FCD domain-containing protein, partial [Chloroflexota bacterium]|nr:FCD domain-containing protein [Chloroflexota bacterium]